MNDRKSGISGSRSWRRTAVMGVAVATLSLSSISSWAHTEVKVRSGALASIVTGDCQVQNSGKGSWKKLGAKGLVQPGDVVKTGKKARLELTFADGTRLRINENSSVVLIKDVTKGKHEYTVIEVRKGQIWANVKKGRGQFATQGEQAVAAVMGTEYRLDTEDELTKTVVYEGEVDVHRPVDEPDQLVAVLNTQPTPAPAASPGEVHVIEGPHEIPGPFVVPGPHEVSIDEWMRIVANQEIDMRANGQANVIDLKQNPEPQSEWVDWNRQQNRNEKV